MLPLLTAAALGFLANQYIGVYKTEAGTQNFELHTRAIAADVVAQFWSVFLALCAWSIAAGRSARAFADTVALPWFRAFGLQLPELPTLPQVPAAPRQLTA
jgi:hypothetical protein